jgi:hypothetical protein
MISGGSICSIETKFQGFECFKVSRRGFLNNHRNFETLKL